MDLGRKAVHPDRRKHRAEIAGAPHAKPLSKKFQSLPGWPKFTSHGLSQKLTFSYCQSGLEHNIIITLLRWKSLIVPRTKYGNQNQRDFMGLTYTRYFVETSHGRGSADSENILSSFT